MVSQNSIQDPERFVMDMAKTFKSLEMRFKVSKSTWL